MREDTTNCPMCGYVNEPMGALGATVHYRCRACGWTYTAINDNHEPDDEDQAQ